jgi:hypothetical protein
MRGDEGQDGRGLIGPLVVRSRGALTTNGYLRALRH